MSNETPTDRNTGKNISVSRHTRVIATITLLVDDNKTVSSKLDYNEILTRIIAEFAIVSIANRPCYCQLTQTIVTGSN